MESLCMSSVWREVLDGDLVLEGPTSSSRSGDGSNSRKALSSSVEVDMNMMVAHS